MLKVEKRDKKWIVAGEKDGWIFAKTFPVKWKAEIALKVYKQGGRVSDYWREIQEEKKRRPALVPHRRIAIMEKIHKEMLELDPTCEEIAAYGKVAGYGDVTPARGNNYFGPRLHNTWGIKRGGTVHIDIGCDGYHLMLKDNSFIEFIKDRRSKK